MNIRIILHGQPPKFIILMPQGIRLLAFLNYSSSGIPNNLVTIT